MKLPVQLYAERNDPIQITAHMCYRDLTQIELHNSLYIRTSRTIIGRQRTSILSQDCAHARSIHTTHGHILTEMTPGLQTALEIEETDTPLLL